MKDYLCKKLFNRLSGTLVIRARCGNNITGLACCNILYPRPDTAVSCILKSCMFLSAIEIRARVKR